MIGLNDQLSGIPFGDPPSRRNAPGTSRDAARTAKRSLKRRCQQAYEAIENAGAHGLTAEECAKVLGLPQQCVGPRFPDLKHAGLIVSNGDKRPTQTGCEAYVWRLAKYANGGAA